MKAWRRVVASVPAYGVRGTNAPDSCDALHCTLPQPGDLPSGIPRWRLPLHEGPPGLLSGAGECLVALGLSLRGPGGGFFFSRSTMRGECMLTYLPDVAPNRIVPRADTKHRERALLAFRGPRLTPYATVDWRLTA